MRLTKRLEKIERRIVPVPGLPLVLIAPAGPDGDAVSADAQRLRARGFTVIVGTTQGDAFDQLVECFAP